MTATTATLDPQARRLLDAVDAEGAPPAHTSTPEEQRRLDEAILAGRPVPEDIAHVEDLAVPRPGGEVPIRVYRPDASPPLGTLVFLHGGGWVIGSLDSCERQCRTIAKDASCVVVSVDYRLAPEHRFPAGVHDAYIATAWVAAHAAELGGDPERVAIGGESSGGNLAAAVALMARDRGGPALVHQLLLYPVVDCEFTSPSMIANDSGFGLDREDMRWYWRLYVEEPEDSMEPYASPMRAPDLAGLPPALVLTAEFDILRDQGDAYARRLAAAGVPVKNPTYDGMIHSFLQYPHVLDRAQEAFAHIARELREAFAPR